MTNPACGELPAPLAVAGGRRENEERQDYDGGHLSNTVRVGALVHDGEQADEVNPHAVIYPRPVPLT